MRSVCKPVRVSSIDEVILKLSLVWYRHICNAVLHTESSIVEERDVIVLFSGYLQSAEMGYIA